MALHVFNLHNSSNLHGWKGQIHPSYRSLNIWFQCQREYVPSFVCYITETWAVNTAALYKLEPWIPSCSFQDRFKTMQQTSRSLTNYICVPFGFKTPTTVTIPRKGGLTTTWCSVSPRLWSWSTLPIITTAVLVMDLESFWAPQSRETSHHLSPAWTLSEAVKGIIS